MYKTPAVYTAENNKDDAEAWSKPQTFVWSMRFYLASGYIWVRFWAELLLYDLQLRLDSVSWRSKAVNKTSVGKWMNVNVCKCVVGLSERAEVERCAVDVWWIVGRYVSICDYLQIISWEVTAGAEGQSREADWCQRRKSRSHPLAFRAQPTSISLCVCVCVYVHVFNTCHLSSSNPAPGPQRSAFPPSEAFTV